MKKLLSLVLAAMMVLALSVTAFAANSETIENVPGSSTQGSINATYAEGATTVVVNKYMVTIDWDQTGTLLYTDDALVYTWNPGTLEYSKTGEAGWTVSAAKVNIKVTNKSDLAVTATCAAPQFNDGLTVTGAYNGDSVLNLGSASKGYDVRGEATDATAVYEISKVEGKISEAGQIGTITVSLDKTTP